MAATPESEQPLWACRLSEVSMTGLAAWVCESCKALCICKWVGVEQPLNQDF
jgi:hypothetical protein